MSKIKKSKIPEKTYPTQNTIITITVDTERIWHAKIQEEVIESVTFDNNQGDGVGIGTPEYLSNVKADSEVTWVGAIKELDIFPNDQVLIYRVDFKSKDAPISFPKGQTKNGRTHVDAIINSITDTADFEYSVSFWVYHFGSGKKEGKGFRIDPKLKMNPK